MKKFLLPLLLLCAFSTIQAKETGVPILGNQIVLGKDDPLTVLRTFQERKIYGCKPKKRENEVSGYGSCVDIPNLILVSINFNRLVQVATSASLLLEGGLVTYLELEATLDKKYKKVDEFPDLRKTLYRTNGLRIILEKPAEVDLPVGLEYVYERELGIKDLKDPTDKYINIL